MTFHYAGKYSGDPKDLPTGEFVEGSVKFREPESSKKLGLIANGISVVIVILTLGLFVGRGGMEAWNITGLILSLVVMVPHEFLHAICFKGDVYMYTNLKQGMLFVVGPEHMTKARFIFMSMLPNLVFGFIPWILFLIFPVPALRIPGMMGAVAIAMGAGDYLNVFNALTQMPKDSRTYLYGFNSYWYMPKGE